YLDGRSAIDEQADHRVGFLQSAATIVAQIEDNAFDRFCLELGNLRGDIACGTTVVLLASPPRIKVYVEGRYLDHADFMGTILALDFNDLAAGSLVFEFDGISSDSDDSGAGGIGRLARDDLQAHLGTLGAADQLDHVIQAHAD